MFYSLSPMLHNALQALSKEYNKENNNYILYMLTNGYKKDEKLDSSKTA